MASRAGAPGTACGGPKVPRHAAGYRQPGAGDAPFGPGVLVEAGGQKLLIDCGRGTTQRLLQAGLRLGQVDALFLTHLHSDHVVGIPDLWLTGWLDVPYAQRKGPFRVYGPGARAR